MKVNLYKIKEDDKDAFLEELFSSCTNNTEEQESNDRRGRVNYQFFLFNEHDETSPSWEWLSVSLLDKRLSMYNNPKAILLIEYKSNYFAFTFGNSFVIANKYCDSNYMFNFARKLKYKTINLTSKVSPYSKKNKTIDSFIGNNSLVFDSGEAYTKIKGKIKVKRDFDIYKENIEVGTSVKLETYKNDIDSLINIVLNVYSNVENEKDKTNIPLLKIVPSKHKTFLEKLDERLISALINKEVNIELSQFDIRGTKEIFNSDADYFEIWSGHKYSTVENISLEEIFEFKDEKSVKDEEMLEISLAIYKDGAREKKRLKEVIDYIDNKEKCVLIQGKWYYFNDDYQQYLSNSLNELEILYDPNFNYSKADRWQFLDDKYKEETKKKTSSGIDKRELMNYLKRKFYRERYYNHRISLNKDYCNIDRNLEQASVGKVEIADLYYKKEEEKTIFSVKIGKASSGLVYVIDQSETTLRLYQNDENNVRNKYPIDKVGLWFVLDRETYLPEKENGQPDINKLNMFILKNRIDEWKKKVRLLGYQPVVRINYVTE